MCICYYYVIVKFTSNFWVKIVKSTFYTILSLLLNSISYQAYIIINIFIFPQNPF